MTRFHAFTNVRFPGLHVWRQTPDGTLLKMYLRPVAPPTNGWVTFEADLDPTKPHPVWFMLFEFENESGHKAREGSFENEVFTRALPRDPADASAWPTDVWLFQDSKRITLTDPAAAAVARVKIHLITANRYRHGKLYLWKNAQRGVRLDRTGEDASGPFWEVDLVGEQRHFFNFKFVRPGGGETPDNWEWNGANRTWTSADGAEVWTHSEAPALAPAAPAKVRLRVRYRQEGAFLPPAKLWLWQDSSDFAADLAGAADPANPGWSIFEQEIYTSLPYGFRFHNPGATGVAEWEDESVRRIVNLTGSAEVWTLEGDPALFPQQPHRNRRVSVHAAVRTPDGRFDGAPLFLHVWIGRGRAPLQERVPVDPATGAAAFDTYEGVTTSFRFHNDAHWEQVGHALSSGDAALGTPLHAVLERAPLLRQAPPAALFTDPPFGIRRPGVYEEGGHLHFVLHAPKAARVRLRGDWMPAGAGGVDLVSTRDGSYWWARLAVADVHAALTDAGRPAEYHGARYHYLLNNDEQRQDPAAGWVEHSGGGANSRLLRSGAYAWQASWYRPTWDYLIVYQLHPSCFSSRGGAGLAPLERVAWEVKDTAGYFRELGATAVLLMPVNEFAGSSSWGYNPSFYYAVEESYGGPDALKKLVDACHEKGLAVLLDVVFNHAGTDDNILWQISRETYFDGDTEWGALVNFDHPQCQHFFAQNLAYLAQEYRLDGFRLDHTSTIVHGHEWANFIKRRGSGGGREFIEACRAAVRALPEGGDRCLIMAEHLPNEWWWSNGDRPLDTQWCDDFHDRFEDACKGWDVMPALAQAFTVTHRHCDDWHDATNYSESHDEVGNENDRVTRLAGPGRGLRMSKVAAAGTLLSRGIPMFFMGEESAEWRQFRSDVLDLDFHLGDAERAKVRSWWKTLCELRRHSTNLRGPAPLEVRYAQNQMLGFTRGQAGDYYVLLNFGGWSGHRPLGELNLPDGTYRERLNSTWPAFAHGGEGEDEHTNGGGNARLDRGDWLHIPDYGAVVLERV